MPKFFAYARVSTKDQGKKYSLETQSKFLHKVFETLTDQDDYEFIEVREEKSAKNVENRESLKSILNNLHKRDIVAVYDISRLGRDTQDVLTMLKLIPSKGAIVYVELTAVNMDSPEEELRRTIDAAVATYQRKVQNIKSRAGIEVKKEKGEWLFRGDMLGYRVFKDQVEIVQDEAEIVRFIFQNYAKGKSIRHITNELSKSGLRNRDATTWYSATVRRYILKPIYMGYYKLKGGGRARGQDKVELTPDTLVKSNKYPPIVSESLWWKCYDSYRHVKRSHSRQFQYRWSAYELSGILTCGYCAAMGKRAAYVHLASKRKGLKTTWEVYVCRVHQKKCKQSIFTLRAEIFEKLFRFAYLIFLSYYEEVEGHFQSIAKEYEGMAEAIESQIQTLNLRVQEKDQKIKQITDKFIQATAPALLQSLNQQVQQIEEERSKLSEQLKSLQAKKSEVLSDLNADYETWINKNQEQRIADFILGDPVSRRDVHKELIMSASIHDKALYIEFVNSKKLVTPLVPTKGRRIQRKFLIHVSYKGEDQYEVTFDTTNDSYSFHNLVEDEDYFKALPGEIYHTFLDKTISKSIEIQKSFAKSSKLTKSDASAE